MNSTGASTHSPRRPWWRSVLLATTALMLLASFAASPLAGAQNESDPEETPDVVIPGTGLDDETDDPEEPESATPVEVEPTEDPAEGDEGTPTDTELSVPESSATDPGYPAVLAQGLAFRSGERVVWQVREVRPAGAGSATAETTNAAFVYQVTGASIIRNEVTGKRALLEPGEAYFKSGGDAYTTFGTSSDAVIWIFEVVGDSSVADDAFYESPLITDYSEGVFDMELIRYVLEPGQSAPLPEHTGPALVMSVQGDIDIESGGLGLLGTGDGQLVMTDGTVFNNSQDPVIYVVAAFGEEVGDATSGAPTTPATGETTTETDSETESDAGTDSETETESGSESGTESDPVTEETSSGSSQWRASINITAQSELYVTVVADGLTVFDGPIPEGGQSGVIVGSSFEVYTSFGAATMFTDACGNDYFMGYETGEARYYLEATADSCPP